ncbi:MAG: hypothetical protein EHM14_15150 [Methanothrix sp.]|nr:MAG: hypothetical protein EHM14_15150 [Methanothrix sp.]
MKEFKNIRAIDTKRLAAEAILFTAADIKTVVQTAARQAIRESNSNGPSLSTENIIKVIRQHPRSISIRREGMAEKWVEEAAEELGIQDKQLSWLKEEIARASKR